MADIWGALAQVAPPATTLVNAYTVPANRVATVEVMICNRGADSVVRVAHAPGGAADAVSQYLLYGAYAPAGETKVTSRFTMSAGDVLRVYAGTANVTFNVNGIEEDA